MSIKLMTEIFEMPIPGTRKLLLLALADHAADDGSSVFPTVATMARRCSLDRRSVQRQLSALRTEGVLQVIAAATASAPFVYRLDLTPLRDDAPPPLETAEGGGGTVSGGGTAPPGGRQAAARGAAVRRPGGGTAPPYPLRESSRRDPSGDPSEDLLTRRARRGSSPTGDGFDAFWSAFPLKVARAEALEVWKRLKPDADLQAKILAAVARQKADPTLARDGFAYLPRAPKWLLRRRWEDETAPPPPLEEVMLGKNGRAEAEAIRRFIARGEKRSE